MQQQLKCLPLYMQPDLYARLERAGVAEERETVQQALWVLRRWLARHDRNQQNDPTTEPRLAA